MKEYFLNSQTIQHFSQSHAQYLLDTILNGEEINITYKCLPLKYADKLKAIRSMENIYPLNGKLNNFSLEVSLSGKTSGLMVEVELLRYLGFNKGNLRVQIDNEFNVESTIQQLERLIEIIRNYNQRSQVLVHGLFLCLRTEKANEMRNNDFPSSIQSCKLQAINGQVGLLVMMLNPVNIVLQYPQNIIKFNRQHYYSLFLFIKDSMRLKRLHLFANAIFSDKLTTQIIAQCISLSSISSIKLEFNVLYPGDHISNQLQENQQRSAFHPQYQNLPFFFLRLEHRRFPSQLHLKNILFSAWDSLKAQILKNESIQQILLSNLILNFQNQEQNNNQFRSLPPALPVMQNSFLEELTITCLEQPIIIEQFFFSSLKGYSSLLKLNLSIQLYSWECLLNLFSNTELTHLYLMTPLVVDNYVSQMSQQIRNENNLEILELYHNVQIKSKACFYFIGKIVNSSPKENKLSFCFIPSQQNHEYIHQFVQSFTIRLIIQPPLDFPIQVAKHYQDILNVIEKFSQS